MTHPIILNTLRVSLITVVTLLSACGGNGSNSSDDNSASSETAQSVSANTVALGPDTVNANAAVLRTVQAVVAGGQATTTVACGSSGTATFTASGGSVASLLNGVLDAGERYSMVFNSCSVSAGSDTVSGLMSLEVISASATELTVQASMHDLVVARPHRTLTLNGSSTLSQSIATSGATVTTTNRWVSPQIELVSLHNARLSSLTLSNVDLTSTSTTTNGALTGSTSSGSITIAVAWLNNSWSATIATQGTASYDANGMATQGNWLMTLPHDRIGLAVAAGLATVTLDHGPDGIIDNTFIWSVQTLFEVAA